MRAWSGDGNGDIMGAAVARTGSAKVTTPPLKNGSDLRESGYLISVGSRTARFRRKHRNKLTLFIQLGLLLVLLCLAITMTVLYVKQKRHKSSRLCESKECLRSAANLALSMDTSADPCEDFHQYVCGNWADDHPRPDAYRSYDWFRDKQTKVYTVVRDFLAKNTSHHPRPVQQAQDMYAACMDTDTMDKRGLKPVIEVLESLGLPSYPTYTNISEDTDYATYTFDWLEAVIKIKTHLGMDVLIGFDLFTDPKNSSVYRLVMGSPETTNPFPSMHNEKKKHNRRTKRYFKQSLPRTTHETFSHKQFRSAADDDDDDEKTRQIYQIFYAELIKLFVIEAGGLKAANLTESELDVNILKSSGEFYNLYNVFYTLENDNETTSDDNDFHIKIPEYTVDEIQAHTDMIVESNNETAVPIWKRYLEGVFSVSDVILDFEKDKILVSEPDLKYMSLMASFLAKTPPASIELYVWVKVAEVMAVHTTSELRMLFQRSYDELRVTKGDRGVPPRSLQCASAVNDMLGMAVSYAIADPRFLNVTKPKIRIMINEMKNALAHLVGKTKWMDDDTKLATYEKIEQMKTLIGFPEWLIEEERLENYYQGLQIDVEKHLENMINIIQVKIITALNRFREPNNFTWATDPTEVNAYHTFQENTISLTKKRSIFVDAAIPLVMLQYPFYDLGLESLNYGSLGTILGHEITHGFDNFGRQFDKNGNLVPWWSNETVSMFVNMTQCFVDQYNSFYLPEVDEHVDGKKTLGENIADNGGLREAMGALKEHLHKTGPEEKLPGFEKMSSEQMFFLAYGNLWCGVSTDDSLRSELDDEHSPQSVRARGALQNSVDFARAWKCPPGSAMNPRHRCIIF